MHGGRSIPAAVSLFEKLKQKEEMGKECQKT